MLKIFLANRMRQLQSELTKLDRLSLLDEIAETAKENASLVSQIKNIRDASKRESLDVTDGLKEKMQTDIQAIKTATQLLNTVDTGIQVECQTSDAGNQTISESNNSSKDIFDSSNDRKISIGKATSEADLGKISQKTEFKRISIGSDQAINKGTSSIQSSPSRSLSNMSPIVPSLDIEDEVETNVRKSHDIFSGFNSTLNRIEDMVKSERKPRSSDISSRFSSTSYSARGDDNFRSSSALGHRYDDTYSSSKYSSPYTTSFSGSTNRLNSLDGYESKYSTRSYASPMYSSSKYDVSKTYGGSNTSRSTLDRYNSVDNLTTSERAQRASQHDQLMMTSSYLNKEEEVKKLELKVKELEKALKDVQQKNEEYIILVQELSNISPNNDQIRDIKRKVKSLQTTTTTTTTHTRKENVKVAHIKPFSSDEKHSKLTYGDYDISICVKNRKSANNSPVPSRLTENKSENLSPNKHISSLVDVNKKLELPTPEKTSEKTATQNMQNEEADFSSSVFDELNKRTGWNKERRRSRPQTWYGHTEERGFLQKQRSMNENDKKQIPEGKLDFNQFKSEEAISSPLKSPSTLSLPDWMRVKKKK